MSKTITIFLASSEELESERRAFENFIYQRCNENKFIKVIAWENNLNNAMSPTRLQDRYNEAIRTCDIFLALFFTKAGPWTVEEFDVAWERFQQSGRPQIFTYFKETVEKQQSLTDFWHRLTELGHFPTVYKNTEDLHLQFGYQLEIYLTEHHQNADFDDKKKHHFPTVAKPDVFIGRQELLAQVHTRLQSAGPVLLVNGLGGIGKTATAQVYINEYKTYYDHIAWVFVAENLPQSLLNQLQGPLDLEINPKAPSAQQFQALVIALQQVEGHNLLVIDNANDSEELLTVKAALKNTGWRVLITSRCHPDEYEHDVIEMNVLPPTDAEALFWYHYQPAGSLAPGERVRERANQLLDKIDSHTLLIELIAKAGKKKPLTIEQLLERLDSGLNHEDLQRIITVGSHADSQLRDKQAKLYEYILAMFEPTDLDEDKQRILRYFSVLPAEDIPLAHLKNLFLVEDDNRFEDDLESLFQDGWLSAKDDTYKMHALVQDVVFVKLPNDYAALITTLTEILQQPLTIAYDYLDYAKAVTQKVTTSGYEIGWLNIFLSDAYENIGQLENALASIKVASEHFRNCDEQDSLAASYQRRGDLHKYLGQLDKAIELFELFNQLMEGLVESNPENKHFKNYLAISYEKLGDIHKALGQVKKALAFFELCHQLRKALYDANPKSEGLKNELAISYEKLGDIHKELGHFDQALEFFELCNSLSKELYDTNPNSQNFKNELAISYEKLGLINEAKGKLDNALKHYEKQKDLMFELYNDNQKSEKIKNDLAISYLHLGNIHKAFGYLDQALAFFELFSQLMKKLYDANPKSVQLKNGLAISYYNLGGIYQAKKIPFYKFTAIRHNKQQVLAMYEKAMTLRQELYQTTQLDAHKKKAEHTEKVHLQVKVASYAPFIQATLVALFGGLYWLDWVSVWWLIGLVIWFLPLRLPVKTGLSIRIALLVLLGLVAWLF